MSDSKVIDKIDALSKELLAIIDANPDMAMMLHIGQLIDEEHINGYSINAGQLLLMTNALYVDLAEQIEDGQFELYLEMEDMMEALRSKYDEYKDKSDDADDDVYVSSGYEQEKKTLH